MGFLPSHSSMLNAEAESRKPHKRKRVLGLDCRVAQEEIGCVMNRLLKLRYLCMLNTRSSGPDEEVTGSQKAGSNARTREDSTNGGPFADALPENAGNASSRGGVAVS